MPYKDPDVQRAKKRQYQRVYRKKYRDEIRLRDAIYREQNREALRERKRRAYKYTEHEKEYRKTYNENNPGVVRRSRAKRRAAKLNALIDMTQAQEAEIKAIYAKSITAPKVRCYLCGKITKIGDRHVDHIMPLSKGGKHKPSNLAIACVKCNLSKHNKHPNEIGLLI